jgi:type II secretory pathway component PulC
VLIDGTNHAEFTLTSDWFGALPYRLHEVGVVSEDKHSFDLVACPEIVTAGKVFGLLLDLRQPTTLSIDAEAEVVGMTTAGSSSNDSRRSATSYAVPIDDALAIAEQISAGRQSGSIRVGPKAYLGITVVAAEGATTGVGVNSVVEGGPADTAGIEAGDILLTLDGVSIESQQALDRFLFAHQVGDTVTVTIYRAGQQGSADITLAEDTN